MRLLLFVEETDKGFSLLLKRQDGYLYSLLDRSVSAEAFCHNVQISG